MAISVMTWVWNHSRSRSTRRLVLLAIADCANSEGGQAWPSVAELMRKAGLGERAVQTALTDLVDLGELVIEYNAGPKGCNRYRVVMTDPTPAEYAPPQIMHPADNAPPQKMRGYGRRPAKTSTPAEYAPPQNVRPTPAESAPVTIQDPSLSDHLEGLANRLARDPDDEPILRTVIDVIHQRTARSVTPGEARRIAAEVLKGRNPRDPVAYVRKALMREADLLTRFGLRTPAPAGPAAPECGTCNGRGRIEDPVTRDDAGRCPDCNPAPAQESA